MTRWKNDVGMSWVLKERRGWNGDEVVSLNV